jgi:hypothetical protein
VLFFGSCKIGLETRSTLAPSAPPHGVAPAAFAVTASNIRHAARCKTLSYPGGSRGGGSCMRRWWLQACTGCGGCRRAWAWLQAGDDCCRRAASSPLASQRRSRCTDGRPSSSFVPPCDQVRLPPPPSIPSLGIASSFLCQILSPSSHPLFKFHMYFFNVRLLAIST